MKVYLKVKIKSLAAEARIIRHEELKFPNARLMRKMQWAQPIGGRDNPTYQGLHIHRVAIVRPEARAALLAYGFLRGRSYRAIEAKCYQEPDWFNVLKIARRFGTVIDDEFKAWRDA